MNAPSRRSLLVRQVVTVALLFCGYGACYFCRADLSVASPLLVADLVRQGLSHDEALVRIGQITSLGVLAYALGKLFLGGLGDYWGGRPNFLIGVGGAALFTALFATGATLPVFTIAWVGNRLTQSVAWAGLIKVSSKWFNYSSHGTIIGILSISYLVGDALARQSMGALIAHGFGWQAVFYFAAGVAAAMLLANLLLLRESRVMVGHTEAQANPLNLFGEGEGRPAGLAALLLPLLRSRAFLTVCVLSFGATIVRETFNTWTPVYLREHAGFGMAAAASLSAVFPAIGVLSVLLSGWLSDRLGASGRAVIMAIGFGAAALALLGLMLVQPGPNGSYVAVAAIGLVAFCLLGPYSYLGGAIALDFGGKRAGAASSGLIDGIGYLGGVLAGDSVARVAVGFGWHAVFLTLAVVCTLSAAAALYLFSWTLRQASQVCTSSLAS